MPAGIIDGWRHHTARIRREALWSDLWSPDLLRISSYRVRSVATIASSETRGAGSLAGKVYSRSPTPAPGRKETSNPATSGRTAIRRISPAATDTLT